MVTFSEVLTPEHIQKLVILAHKIWNQHFVPLIGQAQVDYMLDRFQSEPAISEAITEGVEYTLIQNEGIEAGYLALIPDQPPGKMMISKLYLDIRYRGLGLGRAMLNFIREKAGKKGIKVLWLTVNRNNHDSIDWYIRRGFQVTRELKKDIGGGFYMDDLIMELKLAD